MARRPKTSESEARKSPLTPKKFTFGKFFRTGLSKLKDPWCWWAWFKGVVLGVIVAYIYLEGLPF